MSGGEEVRMMPRWKDGGGGCVSLMLVLTLSTTVTSLRSNVIRYDGDVNIGEY